MFEILRNAYRETGMTAANGQEKLNKMINKPNILAGVSHEVRTQMNSIVAFSYLINNERFNDTENFTGHIDVVPCHDQPINLARADGILHLGKDAVVKNDLFHTIC